MNQIGCSTGLLSHPDKESEAEQCKIKKKKGSMICMVWPIKTGGGGGGGGVH